MYIITGAFIGLDLATGLIKSFKQKNFTSSVMREGLFHKCGSILCVIFGVLVDYAQTFIDLGVQIPLASAMCVYVILMEAGSIIENVGEINPELAPTHIKQYFSKLQSKEN